MYEPLLSVVAILLALLAIGTFLGGADEACEIEEMVLAVSAAIEGLRMDDTGETIDCVVTEGDLAGRRG